MSPRNPTQQYLSEVQERRRRSLSAIRQLPVAALIWGPDPASDSDVARARVALRDELRARGHVAQFSEDLIDLSCGQSVLAQQIADVEAHDVVFSLPASPGSIAEIHDFFKLPHISGKIVTFLDEQWNDGYANKSLIQIASTATSAITLYRAEELPTCIIGPALEYISRLQELFYCLGRRS